MVGGAGAGALVAVDERVGHPVGERRRAEHEVDAQARGSARSAAGSSPSRCRPPARACAAGPRRRTRRRGRPGRPRARGGVTCVDFANCAMSKTSSSQRGDVPVADQRGVLAEPPCAASRAGGPASPACRRSAGRRPCGRWARRATRSGRRRTSRRWPAPRRRPGRRSPACPSKPTCDVLEPDPADDRDAVPLVRAGGRDVVPQGLEAHQRQLVLAGLGLLQRQHVDVVALQERLDAVDAGAEGVDVPGRDAHGPDPSASEKWPDGATVPE